ncbi:DUF4743 domain-containing protein [Pseudoroseomonas globiformis]|uniref:DUF4743 domain-containing protein n=1 Tax=Teichococcus globiformis TaxID=2307229 RepID=A0ABV7FUB4_9PROT
MDRLFKHIAACNNIASPAGLVPFRIGAEQVGWLEPELARFLAFRPRDFHFDAGGVAVTARLPAQRDRILDAAARDLAKAGFLRIRGEPFDIRATPNGPSLARLDRGAIPAFGIEAQGVHLNGLVRRPDGPHVWLGKRALHKAVSPGEWDNMVAGGMPAGLDPLATLIKEAGEEAGVPPEMAAGAQPAGRISYVMKHKNGMRRDILHIFDLELPETFTPRPNDDEVERFELWPLPRVFAAVRDTDDFKFNVNLVLIDLFLREGLIDPASEAGRRLRLELGVCD